MDFNQLLLILRARSSWILFTLFTIAGVATIATLFVLPRLYTATTSVVISFKSNDPFEQPGFAALQTPGYVTTQADIISSHQVALKVVKDLRLAEDPKAIAQFQKAQDGEGSINDWLAVRLLKRLEVKPARERDSRIIHIRYDSTDPQFSARVADAFAEAYIDINTNLNIDPARRNTSWFEGQLKTLRADVEKAQSKLTAFQQKSGIIGAAGDRLDTETQRLTELTTQLTAAQSQIDEVQSRQLGENHPQYKRAVSNEAALRQKLAEQKAKILRLRKQYDDIAMLTQEAQNAQRVYDAALQRYNQTSMESQFTPTDAAILSRAFVPTKPSSPKVLLNLGASIVLGLLLGVGIALGREMADRRVRSLRDIKLDLGLPVVGLLTKGRA